MSRLAMTALHRFLVFMVLPQRNPLVQMILIALVSALGIGSRRYAHALPGFIAAYAGDTLWALAAFLGIGLVLPRASTRTVALLAMAFSVADRTQPVIPRPLDRLDPPDDAGWADPRLRLPLERSRLLRCWGWTRRHPRTDRPGCPQSQEVVSVMRLDPGRPDAPGLFRTQPRLGMRAPSPSGATTSRSCGCRPTTWLTGRGSWTASTTTAATPCCCGSAGRFDRRSSRSPGRTIRTTRTSATTSCGT